MHQIGIQEEKLKKLALEYRNILRAALESNEDSLASNYSEYIEAKDKEGDIPDSFLNRVKRYKARSEYLRGTILDRVTELIAFCEKYEGYLE